MKKEFSYTTTVNGNEVTLSTTLEVTQAEIENLFTQKQQRFIESMNLQQRETQPEAPKEEFSYENYSSEDQDCCEQEACDQSSPYTPYSSVSAAEKETPEDSKGYTPYASLRPRKDFPKSYHQELENGYAPYSTWRVNVPSGKKITIE